MSGNTFGTLYCVTSFGESHGAAYGGVVDGCPPGLALSADDIQKELDRRDILCDWRPGVGVRFGPHFYNNDEDVERGLAELKDIVDGLRA